MKSFITACIILLILIILISANGVFLQSQAKRMTELALALPESVDGSDAFSETFEEICDLWEQSVSLITATVPLERIREIEHSLTGLITGWQAEDDALYRRSRAMLLTAIHKLRDSEGFALDDII